MLILHLPVVLYLVLLAVIVLFVARSRGLMLGASQRVTRSVWCPMQDRRLTATLEEEVWDGRRVDVEQCSAFSPPTAVTCAKGCLRLTKRPRPAPVSSIPLVF